MQIEPLNDDYEITSIIMQPKLWKLSYGQGCLVEEFKVDKTCSYLGVIYQKELCGMFQLKEFNKITVDAHIYMMPSYQNRNLAVKAVKAAGEYVKETTEFKNIITSVPVECTHVFKLLNKTDFKVCGQLTNGIIFNQRMQNLILLQWEI